MSGYFCNGTSCVPTSQAKKCSSDSDCGSAGSCQTDTPYWSTKTQCAESAGGECFFSKAPSPASYPPAGYMNVCVYNAKM